MAKHCEGQVGRETQDDDTLIKDNPPISIYITNPDHDDPGCIVELFGFTIECKLRELRPISNDFVHRSDNFALIFVHYRYIILENKKSGLRTIFFFDEINSDVITLHSDCDDGKKLKYAVYPKKRISKVKRAC